MRVTNKTRTLEPGRYVYTFDDKSTMDIMVSTRHVYRASYNEGTAQYVNQLIAIDRYEHG